MKAKRIRLLSAWFVFLVIRELYLVSLCSSRLDAKKCLMQLNLHEAFIIYSNAKSPVTSR